MMRRFARFLAPPVLATLLAVGATLPAHAAPTSTLEGLDVSHWQGVIDWKQVAGAGYDFAFAKATDGRTFKDPGFTYNREAAQFRGLAFGAYHFARPDKGPNDPAMEVNQFLNVADPQSGELIPVLDLEDSGGLTTDELIAWTWGFLIEFESRTGLKPMIYTGNYFWMTFMRNPRSSPRPATTCCGSPTGACPSPTSRPTTGGPRGQILAVHQLRQRARHRGLRGPRPLPRAVTGRRPGPVRGRAAGGTGARIIGGP